MNRDFTLFGNCSTYSPSQGVAFNGMWSFIYGEKATYQETIDLWILRLSAAYLYQIMYQNYILNASYCESFPSNTDRRVKTTSLSYDHFQGVFYMLLAGNNHFCTYNK